MGTNHQAVEDALDASAFDAEALACATFMRDHIAGANTLPAVDPSHEDYEPAGADRATEPGWEDLSDRGDSGEYDAS